MGKKYAIGGDGLFLHDLKTLLDKHEKLVLVFEGSNSISLSVVQTDGTFSIMSININLEQDKLTVVPIDKSVIMMPDKLSLHLVKYFQTDVFVEFLVIDDFNVHFNKSYKI